MNAVVSYKQSLPERLLGAYLRLPEAREHGAAADAFSGQAPCHNRGSARGHGSLDIAGTFQVPKIPQIVADKPVILWIVTK